MSLIHRIATFTLLSLLPLVADEIILSTGETLTGTVQNIEDSGIVQLDYPFAKAPLALKPSALSACIFEGADIPRTDRHTSAITLISGDKIAGNILSLDQNTLILENSAVGKMNVPRNTISSMAFNLSNSLPIYNGPKNRDEWSESDEWSYEDGALVSNGSSSIYSDVKLPDDFIIRFKCSWESSPQMKVHFCDPGVPLGTHSDRYTFSINRSGIDLKRENSKGQGARYNTIAEIPKRMDRLKEKSVDIEFRVDRTKGVIFIFINGRSEGMHTDPFGKGPPTGTGLTIQSASNASATNKDSVIDVEGQLFTGTIKTIREVNKKLTIFLDNPFSRDGKVMSIPAKYLSIAFLALDTPLEETIQKNEKFTLSLHENGLLNVSEIQLTPESAEVIHAELGKITIQRKALRSITLAPQEKND